MSDFGQRLSSVNRSGSGYYGPPVNPRRHESETRMRQLGLIAALLLPLINPTALGAAESNCKSSSSPCIDARTGETRVCTTTTCYDDKGNVISTTTIVTMQGGTTGQGKPKPGVKSKLLESPKMQNR
jgi:hypothetical protein